MTTVVSASLTLSSDRTSALVQTPAAGFRVYAVPGGEVRHSQASHRGVESLAMSGSGAVVAVHTTDDAVEILRAGKRERHALPYPRAEVRAFAPSDAGNMIALLITESAAPRQSRLEIWPLPVGDEPLATQVIPATGPSHLRVSAGFHSLMVDVAGQLGSAPFTAVYSYQAARPGLSELWTGPGPSAPVALLVALDDTWLWTVTAAGLVGRKNDGATIELPGTLRDRAALTPGGSHLLVYREVESLGATDAKMRFTVIDLSTRQELRHVEHAIASASSAELVLTDALELFELRARENGELARRPLPW